MKKFFIIVISVLFVKFSLFAQEQEKKKDKPVRAPFESGILIDNQTVFIPVPKTLELIIEHRFGKMNNGISDLYGIYAPSNIRLGLNYSLNKKLMLGFGTSKDKKLQDFRLKWNVFEQTRQNTMPVAVTLYGNMAVDARNNEVFGNNYQFTNRLSYFAQIIIARKINHIFSVQIAPSFSHINTVDSLYEHDKLALSFSGRASTSPQSSIIFNYDLPLEIEGIYEHRQPAFKPKPNLGVGWEISTSTHAFQMFIGTAKWLVPQYNIMENANDWTSGDIMIGFNITRLWTF
jgi:hypothetical protein